MYFRVFIKFRVCTCIHDTRYTIHDIDEFRVYTVTSLYWSRTYRSASQKGRHPPDCADRATIIIYSRSPIYAIVFTDWFACNHPYNFPLLLASLYKLRSMQTIYTHKNNCTPHACTVQLQVHRAVRLRSSRTCNLYELPTLHIQSLAYA